MDEFVRWLGEQLDKDAAAARAATPGPWRYDQSKHHHIVDTPLFEEAVFAGPPGAGAICVAGTGETDDQQSMRDAEFIAEHDPARVLREINAKRQVVERYERAMENRRAHPDDLASAGALLALHGAVKLLALPYADRPGYHQEWRP